MWTNESSTLAPGICQYRLKEADQFLTNREFTALLSTSEDFIMFFNDLLKASSFNGYFWEVKPVNEQSLDQAFEFVLVESTRIAQKKPDPRPFMEHLDKAVQAAAFPNLGRNAQLIAPAISGSPKEYTHIAGFVRHAPEVQILTFWQLVGQEFGKSIGPENRWLSTAGFGVNWLHVRIDTRPKYYRYQPYKLV